MRVSVEVVVAGKLSLGTLAGSGSMTLSAQMSCMNAERDENTLSRLVYRRP